MAVESRFVVIRNGAEVETFMDKKTADEYDKMLDMADNLCSLLDQSSLELNEKSIEELSIFLAKNREPVLVALQAKKAASTVAKKSTAAKTSASAKVDTPATVDTPAKVKKVTKKSEKSTLKNVS